MERRGFSILALLFALVALAVLAKYGVEQYRRVVETRNAEVAKGIVESIASSNRSRQLTGQGLVSGAVDGSSPLVAETNLAGPDWSQAPYEYYGAFQTVGQNAPCVAAAGGRRTSGSSGTRAEPYRLWGFCASIDGRLEPFDDSGACVLTCGSGAPTASSRAPVPAAPAPVAPQAAASPAQSEGLSHYWGADGHEWALLPSGSACDLGLGSAIAASNSIPNPACGYNTSSISAESVSDARYCAGQLRSGQGCLWTAILACVNLAARCPSPCDEAACAGGYTPPGSPF